MVGVTPPERKKRRSASRRVSATSGGAAIKGSPASCSPRMLGSAAKEMAGRRGEAKLFFENLMCRKPPYGAWIERETARSVAVRGQSQARVGVRKAADRPPYDQSGH